jgi:hypothetical protein
MNRVCAISFALLLALTVVAAQTASRSQSAPQQILVELAAPASSCPISLHAKQAPGGDAIEVNGTRIQDPAQRLHLSISGFDSRRIVAANVTVRGFNNQARYMPTMSAQDSSDAARTLDVRFPAGSGKETAADLRVPDLTAVTVIELNSVTYSDGSTWKLAAGSSCRSWIDGLMLVSSH